MSNMTRFDPFSEMMTLREAMNSLLEDSFVNPRSARGQAPLGMPVDVAETKDAFVVEAVLPGMKAEDLDITIQDNVLTISGEVRQEQSAGEKASYHRIERRYGRVSRSIGLPTQVQANRVQAQLNNGVLRLEIPKAESVKPRKIAVTNAAGNTQNQALEVNSEQANARGQ